MKLTAIMCFFVICVYLGIGELVATKTKAAIPSVFVAAVCFLLGYWTFAPKTLVADASFAAPFVSVCMSCLLVHMGTLMSVKKLIDQWRAVLVALFGVCGTILISMTIGAAIFGRTTAVVITPPLTGGILAALLMSQAVAAKGLTALVAMPIAMFVMHSFVGYPITSWCLKREGNRIMKDYRANGPDEKVLKESMSSASEKKKIIPRVPEAYLSPYLILAKVILVGIGAKYLSDLTGGAVNQYVICLILGVIFCEIGFLEESALVKAGVFNWLMLGLLAYAFSTLSSVTPAVLAKIIVPIIVLIILGVTGMFITSSISGRFIGYSKEMSFACALTALFGFPADYIITHEVCGSVASNEEEKGYLLDILLPRMLVGGFATVSVASVIIASIFINLL